MQNLREVPITNLPFVGKSYGKKLENLGITNIWELFHHIPFRFLDFTKNVNIKDLQIGQVATIKGEVSSYINQYTRKGRPVQIVTISDSTGKVNAIWFNQIYLSRTLKKGSKVAIAGELSWFGRQKAIISPEYEILNPEGNQIHTGGLIPIYGETAGVSSKWLRRRIFDAWKRYENEFIEFLSPEILKKYNLITFREAISGVHFPKTIEEFETAKKRLAFNELLELHSQNIKRKNEWDKIKTKKLEVKKYESKIKNFIDSLPFKLTNSQQTAINEILKDLAQDIPMNRLLEGDVGSGKTVVAAIAFFLVYLNKKKSVLMAPTQILAIQHYKTLKNLFSKTKVTIGLWTATQKDKGDFDIIVGTHALQNKKLKNISLVVIDEQHKFGVKQRTAIEKLNSRPHTLTMTATPIPRTVALTFFGDLSLSILKESPSGRQKITTWIVPKEKRLLGYNWIKDKIKKEKVQAFVVCPLIEESKSETLLEVKAANKQFEELKKMFPDLKIGLMHGRLKDRAKEKVINDFKDGKLDMLVTTPVVEVGIDIANATIMVIEASDRFGLASLHQLRGRVGRGTKKSYCLLLTENDNEKSQIRLQAMTKSNSGFELSELDLALRGPGEIYGTRQSGIPELKIADWSDLDLISQSREVAKEITDRI